MLPVSENGQGSEMLLFKIGYSSKTSLFYITKGNIVKCRHLQHLIVIPGVYCCSGNAAQLLTVFISVLRV